MAKEFRFPDVGEGITEGEIVRWLVKEGDEVKADQSLAEIETDKAVVEMPSPYAGTVLKLHFKEKDIVKVGQVLVTIGEKGESLAAGPPGPQSVSRPAAPGAPAGIAVAAPRAAPGPRGPARFWPRPRSGPWPRSSASTWRRPGHRPRRTRSPRTTSGRSVRPPRPRRSRRSRSRRNTISTAPSSGSPCAASAGPRPGRCGNPWTRPPTSPTSTKPTPRRSTPCARR